MGEGKVPEEKEEIYWEHPARGGGGLCHLRNPERGGFVTGMKAYEGDGDSTTPRGLGGVCSIGMVEVGSRKHFLLLKRPRGGRDQKRNEDPLLL